MEALRARLLTQDVLDLPERISQFIEATNQRFDTLEAALQEFIEATNQRFDRLEAALQEFIEATNQRLDRLEARQDRLEATLQEFIEATNQRFDSLEAALQEFIEATNQRLDRLEARQDRLEATLQGFIEATDKRFDALEAGQARHEAELKGIRRDLAILRGGHARTTAIRDAATIARSMGLRRTRILSQDDMWDMTDSADTSGIHSNVLNSFRRADLVMEATNAEDVACYIAAEISFTIHQTDISRASRNSRFLTRFTGRPAFAAVAGERVHADIQDVIDSGGVFWHQLEPDDLEVE